MAKLRRSLRRNDDHYGRSNRRYGSDYDYSDDDGNDDGDDDDDDDDGDDDSEDSYDYDSMSMSPSYEAFAEDNEGDIHCHGFVWADGANLDSFIMPLYEYVRNFDHIKTRGYYGRSVFVDTFSCLGMEGGSVCYTRE